MTVSRRLKIPVVAANRKRDDLQEVRAEGIIPGMAQVDLEKGWAAALPARGSCPGTWLI